MSRHFSRTPSEEYPAGRGGPAAAVLVVASVLFFFISTWSERERVLLVPAFLLLLVGGFLLWRSRNLGLSALLPWSGAVALLAYDLVYPRVLHHPEGLYNLGPWAMTHTLVWLGLGAILGIVFWRRPSSVGRWFPVSLLALTLASGASLILLTPNPPIDVWELHDQAGQAFLRGDDPYSQIDVASTFQFDTDSGQVTGYPYPPLSLLTHGISAGLFGDSRWVSLLAWMAVVIVATGGIRRLDLPMASLIFLLASQPAWYPVVEAAYSEPVSIALLVGGLTQFRRRPGLGAVLFGLALGSKQYLAALLPLILVAPVLSLRHRVIASLTAVGALGVGALWGLGDYLDSTVWFHTRVPPQERSINLFGMLGDYGFSPPPTLVTLLLVGIVAVALGRTVRVPSQLGVAAAGVLSVGFLLGTQAFANYWLVVASLLIAAVSLSIREHQTMEAGHGKSAKMAPTSS